MRAYLTIDDGPSENMGNLLDYLIENECHAVFFCQGDNIEKNKHSVIRAIQNGFAIGNHSHSHPRFSEIPLEEGIRQILKTEALIDAVHEEARIERTKKYFRFPYGDPGREHQRYQLFLRDKGFSVPNTGRQHFNGSRYDWYWSVDSEDWKLEPQYSCDFTLDDVFKNLQRIEDGDVILVHDHPLITNVFFKICETLTSAGVTLAKPLI